MSEPSPDARKPTWWERNKGASIVSGFVGAIALLATVGWSCYTAGERNGERGSREQLDKAAIISEREKAKIESDNRQCIQTNASLQALLQLSEKDRNRLLEATAVEPSIRITAFGKPLIGELVVESIQAERSAAEIMFWLENTGVRGVIVIGIEILTDGSLRMGQPESVNIVENGVTFRREWIDINFTLSPGARRYVSVPIINVSKFDPNDKKTMRLALFSSGYLPLRRTWSLLFP